MISKFRQRLTSPGESSLLAETSTTLDYRLTNVREITSQEHILPWPPRGVTPPLCDDYSYQRGRGRQGERSPADCEALLHLRTTFWQQPCPESRLLRSNTCHQDSRQLIHSLWLPPLRKVFQRALDSSGPPGPRCRQRPDLPWHSSSLQQLQVDTSAPPIPHREAPRDPLDR